MMSQNKENPAILTEVFVNLAPPAGLEWGGHPSMTLIAKRS
ncbi:hypothetical protein C942_02144 [Photobacterium marinum]|uniref:Uncharacterized protein n=1 Tax=Photobacterium marinum TaxID=1056511 RepID=L8J841_9GAMM|nr:hypothetical protein C942_02144 [Photobacterium marinum]